MSEEERLSEIQGFLSLDNPDESYEKLNTYLQEWPDFYQILLHFLLLEDSPIQIKFTALTIISNNYVDFFEKYEGGKEEILGAIFENAPNLCNDEQLSRIIAKFMFNLINTDQDTAESIYGLISTLYSQEGTILAALYILSEITGEPDMSVDLSLLAPIHELIPDQRFTIEALKISRNIASSYQPIIDEIIPVIFEHWEEFDETCLSFAAKICAEVFINYQIEECLQHLAQALSVDSEVVSADILEYIDIEAEKFTPNPDFLQSLLLKLQTPDDDPLYSGICSTAQDVIHKIANANLESFLPVYMELFNQIEDLGWKLRSLFPILDLIPNAAEFVPFVEEALQGDEKGEAVLNIVPLSHAVPTLINSSIDIIMPLLEDENSYIQRMSIYALGVLFDGQFEASEERLQVLVQVFSDTEQAINESDNPETTHSLQEFFSYIVSLTEKFVCKMSTFDISANEGLFTEVSSLIEEGNEEREFFEDALVLVAAMIRKSEIEFCDEFAALGERALGLMNGEDDSQSYNSCKILYALLSKYPENMSQIPYFLTILSSIYEILLKRIDTDYKEMIELMWKTISVVFDKVPELPQEVCEGAFEIAKLYYSVTNYNSSIYIAPILQKLAPNIEPEDLMQLMETSKIIVTIKEPFPYSHVPIQKFIEACNIVLKEKGVETA